MRLAGSLDRCSSAKWVALGNLRLFSCEAAVPLASHLVLFALRATPTCCDDQARERHKRRHHSGRDDQQLQGVQIEIVGVHGSGRSGGRRDGWHWRGPDGKLCPE